MHYPQHVNDPLERLSDLPYYDTDSLGQWGAIAAGVASAIASKKSGSGPGDATGTSTPGGTGLPGDEPSVPRQPSAVTTVSPTFQTEISPMISPVMTQQMASPGASVGASPQQFMPGGMSAEHGVTPWGNWAAPGMPGTQPGVSPLQPYTIDPSTGSIVPLGPQRGQMPMAPEVTTSPVHVGGGQRMTDIPWVPIAIVGAGVALALMLGQRRRPRKK